MGRKQYAENIRLLGAVSVLYIQVLTNFPQLMLQGMVVECELGFLCRLAV